MYSKYNSNVSMGISVLHMHAHAHAYIVKTFADSRTRSVLPGAYMSSHFHRATTSLTYLFILFFFCHNDINLSRTAALKSSSNRVMFSSCVGGPFTYTYIHSHMWCLNTKNGYIPSQLHYVPRML